MNAGSHPLGTFPRAPPLARSFARMHFTAFFLLLGLGIQTTIFGIANLEVTFVAHDTLIIMYITISRPHEANELSHRYVTAHCGICLAAGAHRYRRRLSRAREPHFSREVRIADSAKYSTTEM